MIKVLDHGYVRLVDFMGTDLSIVRAARVSYDAAWRAGADQGSDERLIKYLLAHHHSTPFESVTFTFEVKAPIFVVRQWHRHRTWTYNELSARYRELPEEYYVPAAEVVGVQSASNKQGRDLLCPEDLTEVTGALALYEESLQRSFGNYRTLLAGGWPRELARAVLPVAAYTHMFATVNLHNLLRFLTLRLDAHAQYEIRQYAQALEQLAATVVPVTMKAWR